MVGHRDGGGGGVDWESLAEATSGAIGSLVSTTVLYPLDTCKTKFQAELQTQQGAQKYRYCCSFIPSLSLFSGRLIRTTGLVCLAHRKLVRIWI